MGVRSRLATRAFVAYAAFVRCEAYAGDPSCSLEMTGTAQGRQWERVREVSHAV
jgi:hypothetical protein